MYFTITVGELSADMLETNGISHLNNNTQLEVEILSGGDYEIEMCHKITIGTGLLLDRKVAEMKFRIDEWSSKGEGNSTAFAENPAEALAYVAGLSEVFANETDGICHTSIQSFVSASADMEGWHSGCTQCTSPKNWA
jgi:hypothetical protein